MGDTDTWFLLVQHKRAGRTDVRVFADLTDAATAYSEAERRYKDQMRKGSADVDVLLVGASSLDVVKSRYPSYFTNIKSRSKKVEKLLADLPAVFAH